MLVPLKFSTTGAPPPGRMPRMAALAGVRPFTSWTNAADSSGVRTASGFRSPLTGTPPGFSQPPWSYQWWATARAPGA